MNLLFHFCLIKLYFRQFNNKEIELYMLETLKIGILGGGQLGGMLIRSAIDFGLNICVMDKDPNAPCARYTSSFTCTNPADYEAVMAFGEKLDVLTIEKENVNTQALLELSKRGVKVFPHPETIGIIQDKYLQKKFLENIGVPVVPGVAVLNKKDVIAHANRLPFCLKKCRSGYDGKGVMIMRSEEDLQNAFDEPCVLEELVQIKQELSVIVSRDVKGNIQCYDPVHMIFDKERLLLDFQICPANIPEELSVEASNIAIKIAEGLKLVGILAVEMFVTSDGKLLVNELAPRPHNSGHHTIEACNTSQYEQHLRAILGMPLGDTSLKFKSAMINILEPRPEQRKQLEAAINHIASTTGAHLHWYGKTNSKEGRKIGHVTITAENIENALLKTVRIRNLINNKYEKI